MLLMKATNLFWVVMVVSITMLSVLAVGEEWKPSEAYREIVNRIEVISETRDISSREKRERLETLENIGQEIEQKWRTADAEAYARATLRLCQELGSRDFGARKQYGLAQHFAMSVLEKVDDIPLGIVCKLLRYTRDNVDVAGEPLKGKRWLSLRKKQVTLWLRTWQRVERAIDDNWDPNKMSPEELPVGNVSPPTATGLPSGVAPSEIKDPKLRAQYEAAIAANEKKAEAFKNSIGLAR